MLLLLPSQSMTLPYGDEQLSDSKTINQSINQQQRQSDRPSAVGVLFLCGDVHNDSCIDKNNTKEILQQLQSSRRCRQQKPPQCPIPE